MNLFLDAFAWLSDPANWSGPGSIPQRIAEHLWITAVVLLIAAAIALPIGVIVGHTGRGRELAVRSSGGLRALPTLGVLTLFGIWIGIGLTAPIIALVILAIPPLLAGAYAGFESVDRRTIDAARAVGMQEMQIVGKVELPLGLPILVGGIRSATLQIIATATLAAYIADAGLGRFIFEGLKTRNFGEMLGGSILVIILALIIDGCFAVTQRLVVPAGVQADSSQRPPLRAGPAPSGRGATHHRREPGMITAGKGRLVALAAVAVGATVALAGCASGDPLDGGSGDGGGSSETIVIGSQDYYSNEIIAELYAQALEENGFTVDRQFRIGQREVYIPEIESGAIDVFPEYTGNLLQFYVPDTTATTSDDVYAELETSLPDGLRVLDQSPATDQDSYNVTRAFSDENGVTSLVDLKDVTTPLTLGGNSELATRPYGPDGLKSVYGVDVAFTPIEDSGGPLTLKALVDNQVQLVNIYSADPNIAANDLVTLEDPEGLFLASNVVPVVSEKVTDEIAEIINTVSAALTAEDLVALNSLSVNEQESADQIASDWLAEKSLF